MTNKTILVVDDDPLIAMNTADMVLSMGYTAVECHSGSKALEALENDPAIAAIISDQSMPGMTGLELVAAARSIRPGIPALLITGYGDLTADGANSVPRLVKPFLFDQLEAEINRVLYQAA